MNQRGKLALIVAGEASADLHGSNLVRAMKSLDPDITFWGIGGKRMQEAGVHVLISASDMAVIGLTEVLSRLHRITRARMRLKNLLKTNNPNLLILIDYPGFNIHLAKIAKGLGVPVLYYICPQTWAWRRGRVRKIARRVDEMAVILPFEEAFYRKEGVSVSYVGHPLLDAIPDTLDKGRIIQDLNLRNGDPVIGLLPGSRSEEIRKLLPPMIEAAEILSASFPRLKCVLPVAETLRSDQIQPILKESAVEVRASHGDMYGTLTACDLALVASGTATLEAAIVGVPMIIVYKASPITFWVGKRVIKVPYLGLVNLVADEKIVPELIQGDLTAQRLAREASDLLKAGQKRDNMIRNLSRVKDRLGGPGASERTARMAIEMMAK